MSRVKGVKKAVVKCSRSGGYELLLVKADKHRRRAVIRSLGIVTRSLATAQLCAWEFNQSELRHPIGVWAVISPRNIGATNRSKIGRNR